MMAAAVKSPSSVRLGGLLDGMALVSPAQDRGVTSLHLDSREVRPGGLFIACAGSRRHGLDFLRQALERKAAAVVCEPGDGWPPERIRQLAEQTPGAAILTVEDLSAQVSRIAGRFFGEPGEALTLIGVTGTNGKTSCTQFLAQALSYEAPCGVIGTLGSGFPGALVPGSHTTPDPVNLQGLLAGLKGQGAAAVAMEVSSHALDQGRVAGLPFDVAVLTNLSRDHLDYHGDMSAYGQAKQRLFRMPGLKCAVLNLDDPLGRELLAELPADVAGVGYAQQDAAGTIRAARQWVRAVEVDSHAAGMTMMIESSWGQGRLDTRLLGRFNASNLLAALSVLLHLGTPLVTALERLSVLENAPGRMEQLGGGAQPLVVVDYAHTPDAIGHVLSALRAHTAGKLICVFGCGGDRDRGKRPEMAAIAESLSDLVIVTDDNPRTEDGDQIVADILAGLRVPEKALVVRDRGMAIRTAIERAGDGDLVLVAGKGHETTQQIGDIKLPFDDRDQVSRVLTGAGR